MFMFRMMTVMFLFMAMIGFGICWWMSQRHEHIQTYVETECVIQYSGESSYVEKNGDQVWMLHPVRCEILNLLV